MDVILNLTLFFETKVAVSHSSEGSGVARKGLVLLSTSILAIRAKAATGYKYKLNTHDSRYAQSELDFVQCGDLRGGAT